MGFTEFLTKHIIWYVFWYTVSIGLTIGYCVTSMSRDVNEIPLVLNVILNFETDRRTSNKIRIYIIIFVSE